MTNYPTSLDSLVNPASSDTMSAVGHAAQHANVNDAVEALEAKLGIGSSVAASNKLLRGTGAGASAWDKDAPTGTIVGTTDSQTLTNKTLTSPTINTAIINNPTLKTDTIAEFTAAAGVTVDGLLLKDSKLATANSVITSNITDDAVTAAKIDWATTGANGGIWWEELGRTSLGSSADTISVSSIPARNHLFVIIAARSTGGTTNSAVTFNGDSSANYARALFNGSSYSQSTATSNLNWTNTVAQNFLITMDIVNFAAIEKIVTANTTEMGVAGAATAPSRLSGSGKWANTAAQISSVTMTNAGAGDYAAGTVMIVLGHN